MNELTHALRRLRHRPGHVLVVLLTLGVGLGATTAVFTLLQAALLRPLPFEEPDRLVRIWERQVGSAASRLESSPPELDDWRRELELFEGVASWVTTSGGAIVDLDGAGPLPQERLPARIVSGDFFEVLGAGPLLGRALEPGDDRSGASPVAVVSETLWRERLGGTSDVLGRSLRVEGVDLTVVGVMPAEVDFPLGSRLWMPLGAMVPAELLDNRTVGYLNPIARLRADVTLEQATAELDGLLAELHVRYPKPGRGTTAELVPLTEIVRGDARPALLMLFAAAGLVLLVACANVANLEIVRGLGRSGEIAVRGALGADPRQLLWSPLVESALLSLGGVVLGLGVAQAVLAGLVRAAPIRLFRGDTIALDLPAFGFAAAAALVAAMAAGLAPALAASAFARRHGAAALGAGSARAGSGRAQDAGRRTLVVAQVALATVLLLASGLAVRSFEALQRVEVGFDRDRLLTAHVPLDGERYPDLPALFKLYEELIERVEALPGVEAAAALLVRPLEGPDGYDYPFTIAGREQEHEENPLLNFEAVTPGYFRAAGLELLEGRALEASDDADAPPVSVVSRSFARRWFGGGSAVGARLKWGPPDSSSPWTTIVGVVEDARYRALDTGRHDVYVPHRQSPWPLQHLVVRAAEPAAVVPAIAAELRAIDPELTLLDVATGEQLVEGWLGRPRFLARLVSLFAIVTLGLGALGLYSVVAHGVGARRAELAVRAAMGARPRDLRRETVAAAARLAAAGVGLGLGASLALYRVGASWLGTSLYQPRLEWPVLAALVLVLGASALAAAWLPARRAGSTDPARLLRG